MADPNQDLFSDSTSRPPQTPRAVWHLATNQLNLMYMLALGLVPSPKGFGRKYYCDGLSVFPGWIPLFPDVLPVGVTNQAVSEGNHLRCVIAALDLSHLRGPVTVVDRDGILRKAQYPDDLAGDEQALFVPAPLPAAWIQAILFASKDEQRLAEEEAGDYANVPFKAYKRQVRGKLFSGDPGKRWPPQSQPLPDGDSPLHHISGIGATMAMLFGIGNTSDAAALAASAIFDLGAVEPSTAVDPVLSGLRQWAAGVPPSDADEMQSRMLSQSLASIVAEKQRAASGEPGVEAVADVQQAVLDYLELERSRLEDERLRIALERLAHDLEGIMGLGHDTVSDLLQRHSKPFSRALLLFFLREECGELLEFHHPLLTGMDYVAAAALFAATSGWLGIPPELRNRPGLASAATHRMAVEAHRAQKTGLDLGPAPERCRAIRELLAPSDRGWTKVQQEAAADLARGLGWTDAIRKRSSLGKGEYRLQVDGAGAHILMQGDVKAVTTVVDQNRLFDLLSFAEIPVKVDAAVRAKLKA